MSEAAGGMTSSESPSTPSELRAHSCTLCQQRKVKCDRKSPCSCCVRLSMTCIYRAPVPSRRRKKKVSETDLEGRLRRYEEMMKGYGAKIDERDDGAGQEMEVDPQFTLDPARERSMRVPDVASEGTPSGAEVRKLVAQHGRTKYLDKNLWTGITDEFRDAREILRRPAEEDRHESSTTSDTVRYDEGAFLLSSNASIPSLRALHPQPVQIFRLWQAFLDNVNPLSKVLHAPTVQHQILEATGNLDAIPKGMEALMFAIYAIATCSLDDAECQKILGEPKPACFAKYSTATQQALIRAGFLKTTELVVCQAFVLFLLATRQNSDPHSHWILTGVAVRIGQRLGLHRDGASLGLPIFESEIRRRVGWQIVLLDSRSAHLSGCGTSIVANLWDTKAPLNINDSSLYPDMREMPLEHTGATEMIFCLVRYEFGRFLWQQQVVDRNDAFDGALAFFSNPSIPVAEKDKKIDAIEALLASKILRYCDPAIPLHFLATGVARSAVCKLRLLAHHPRQYPDKGASMPQAERDVLFTNSLRMLEFDALGQSTESLKRFLWHMNVHFQFDAFVFLLSELRGRPAGEMVDRAWVQIEEAYRNHPELITESGNPLYVAVGNLTVKAWIPREVELKRRYQREIEVPRFIQMLRAQGAECEGEINEEAVQTVVVDFRGIMAGPSAPKDPVVNTDEYVILGGPRSREVHSNVGRDTGGASSERDGICEAREFQLDSMTMDLTPMDWNYLNDLLEQSTDYSGGADIQLFGD